LEAKIKELETAQTRNAKEENSSSYVEFMKKRLEESQLESKRNLDALIDLRSQFAAHLND
jgi:DNA modification methylase